MNRNYPAYKDDEGFRRIAVLLLSLAALAEQAALRSWSVRWLMLWLLRPAEEAALGFAAQAGWMAPPLILADDPDNYSDDSFEDRPGDGPHKGSGEAARLAWMFRALAAFFFDLSYQAAQLIFGAGHRTSGCPTAGGLKAARLYALLAAPRPRYADSS